MAPLTEEPSGWDAEALASELGLPVVVHELVDSTMTTAAADPRPRALHVAERQLAGEGRHGRRWSSPPGNLYATIVWTEAAEPLPPALLCAIQVVWCEAVAAAGGPRTRCKWPNDGMVAGAKWAGLLARRSGGAGGARLLVGLGANLERAPAPAELDAGATAAALADHWEGWPGRAAVGSALLAAALAVLRDGSPGVAERLARWPLHDAIEPGAMLGVEEPGGARTGRYLGLAPDGRLRLASAEGEVRLAAGDVRRLRPAG